MARKTIIEVKERNPYGEEIDAEYLERTGTSVTAVPGYSDKRQQRDAALARGEAPPPLNGRLQWARAQTLTGQPDLRKVAEWKSKGYVVLTPEKAKELGYDLAGSAAIVEGNQIRLNENVLMYAPPAVAAARYQAQRKATDAQFAERVQAPLEASAAAARARGVKDAVFEFEVEQRGKGKGTGK